MSRLSSILIFVISGVLLLIVVNFLFSRLLKRSNSIHLKFFKSLVNVLVVIIFTYTYLSQFDLTKDISKTLMRSGTLVIAIATFAAQRALSNVISGISISVSKPFSIGDKIKVISSGGSLVSEGIVIDINLRHTIIKKYDGQCDIIPNSVIDSSVISNTNLIENVGNFIELEISYDSDLELACSLIKRVIVENDLTLNSEESTDVIVKDFSSNGVVLRVLVTSLSLDDSFKACSDIRKEILREFSSNGVSVPYQTITLLKE